MTIESQICEINLWEASDTDISILAEHHRRSLRKFVSGKANILELQEPEKLKKLTPINWKQNWKAVSARLG